MNAITAPRTVFPVLGAISFSHFLNDTMQSLLLASYPLFKSGFDLNFAQIGLITLAFQFTASLLQPLVGRYTDRHPQPFSLAAGMGFTLTGLLLLSMASSFPVLLLAAALVGSGPITVEFLSAVLGSVLHEDCVLFNEYWGMRQMFAPARPGSYFYLPATGGLGWALPAATTTARPSTSSRPQACSTNSLSWPPISARTSSANWRNRVLASCG